MLNRVFIINTAPSPPPQQVFRLSVVDVWDCFNVCFIVGYPDTCFLPEDPLNSSRHCIFEINSSLSEPDFVLHSFSIKAFGRGNRIVSDSAKAVFPWQPPKFLSCQHSLFDVQGGVGGMTDSSSDSSVNLECLIEVAEDYQRNIVAVLLDSSHTEIVNRTGK